MLMPKMLCLYSISAMYRKKEIFSRDFIDIDLIKIRLWRPSVISILSQLSPFYCCLCNPSVIYNHNYRWYNAIMYIDGCSGSVGLLPEVKGPPDNVSPEHISHFHHHVWIVHTLELATVGITTRSTTELLSMSENDLDFSNYTNESHLAACSVVWWLYTTLHLGRGA